MANYPKLLRDRLEAAIGSWRQAHRGYQCAACDVLRKALGEERAQQEPERGWQPIETAPKDGTHFLACSAHRAYSEHWTFNQAPPVVVHWWANPGEDGFYLSAGGDGSPLDLTHWMPLPEPPTGGAQEPPDEGPECGGLRPSGPHTLSCLGGDR